MMAYEPCPRCGSRLTYCEDDTAGGPSIACLACGQRTWPTAPAPWTPQQGIPRPPIWKGEAT